jgi:hypothetical protein
MFVSYLLGLVANLSKLVSRCAFGVIAFRLTISLNSSAFFGLGETLVSLNQEYDHGNRDATYVKT